MACYCTPIWYLYFTTSNNSKNRPGQVTVISSVLVLMRNHYSSILNIQSTNEKDFFKCHKSNVIDYQSKISLLLRLALEISWLTEKLDIHIVALRLESNLFYIFLTRFPRKKSILMLTLIVKFQKWKQYG